MVRGQTPNSSVASSIVAGSPIELGVVSDTQATHSIPGHGDAQDDLVGVLDDAPHGQEFSLPPVDTGKDAWRFLAAAFMMEALVWGFAFSYGVFQDYYSSHEPFQHSGSIAIVGTCALGIMYLTLPLAFILLRMYPRVATWLSPIGLVIMCLALAVSSFSTTVTHLILTQGILYAVGGCLAYAPAIMYMDQWFVKRKGLAYGIMWSGTGLAGVILPLVIEALLTNYGIQTTLRTFALVIFVLTVPLAFFIKPRVPASAATRFRPFTLRFLYQRRFSLYQFTNVLQALGYFLPGLYLPLYARITLGASPFMSALTVLLLNVASVFGCVVMGTLSDRLDVTTCLLICGGGAALSTLLFWGLASSMPLLYVFSIVYGLFAGSFSSTWPGVMYDMELKDRREREQRSSNSAQEIRAGKDVDGVMVFAFLGAGRGIGNVVSGPLADAMVKGLPWKGQAAAGYGSGYGTLIVFTGVTALCGGASFLFKRLGWL